MASSEWTDDTERLALALAIRGDMLTRVPGFGPQLFGSVGASGAPSPKQRLAIVINTHFHKYGSPPPPAAIEQEVLAERKKLSPEEGAALDRELGNVLAVPIKDDPEWLYDLARGWVAYRRLADGINAAAKTLTGGPEAIPRACEMLAKVVAPAGGGPGIELVRGSDVALRAVPWVWEGCVPRGALTLFTGDPDVNKTTLLLDLAARITRGSPFPDGAAGVDPETVVFLSAEDSTESTLMPRFLAAGGDPARIYFMKPDSARVLSIEKDIPELAAKVKGLGGRHVMLDPLNAFLPKTDSWKDTSIRTALAPLAAFASESGATAYSVMHLSKDTERSALHRVLGSIGYTAMSRAVYTVARDPDNSNRRLFLSTKMNLAVKPTGLAFTLAPEKVRGDGNLVIETLKIVWEGAPVLETSDELMARAARKRGEGVGEQAERVIRELLKDGPVATETMENGLSAAGVTERTWERARRKVGALSVKDPAPNGAWYWTPPGWTVEQRQAWLAERRKP